MADIQIITDVPLFTNEQNQNDKKLIVLSPSSLPFDDNPTNGSHNLVDSNTIYNLSRTLNTNIKNADTTLSGKLQTQIQNAVPIGTVIAFAANKAPTGGYLICGGGVVSRTTYKKLFDVIGTTYGAGDGKTTFKLPNLTNRFIMGYGTDNAVGTYKAAGLPNITGTFGGSNFYGPTGAFTVEKKGIDIDEGSGPFNRGFKFDASKSSSIYGNSTTVQPPSVTMRFYIKYK